MQTSSSVVGMCARVCTPAHTRMPQRPTMPPAWASAPTLLLGPGLVSSPSDDHTPSRWDLEGGKNYRIPCRGTWPTWAFQVREARELRRIPSRTKPHAPEGARQVGWGMWWRKQQSQPKDLLTDLLIFQEMPECPDFM